MISTNGGWNINKITILADKSVAFYSGVGNTITVGTFIATGTVSSIITITSDTLGQPFYLVKTSGIVGCDYLSLTDSIASGGATFYAGSHSTDVSGNSGWLFSDYPGSNGISFMSLFGRTKEVFKTFLIKSHKPLYQPNHKY